MKKARVVAKMLHWCFGAFVPVLLFGCASPAWRNRLQTELPAFGHRNWIVVADSAYPKQSAGGIETIATGQNQLDVVETVLRDISSAPHVQPIIYLDAELQHVSEQDAPGITAYRKALGRLLDNANTLEWAHEDIIEKLDADSELFNVLILKTDMVLPYTSVFINLDCGYWDEERETRLRNALK